MLLQLKMKPGRGLISNSFDPLRLHYVIWENGVEKWGKSIPYMKDGVKITLDGGKLVGNRSGGDGGQQPGSDLDHDPGKLSEAGPKPLAIRKQPDSFTKRKSAARRNSKDNT